MPVNLTPITSAAAAITLNPAVQSNFTFGSVTGFRFTVTATSPVGLPDAGIFRYLAIPLQPTDTVQHAEFDGVCSPVDMAEFPLTAPALNANPAWFRLSTLDLLFRTRAEAEDALQSLYSEVQILLNSYDLTTQLNSLTSVTFTATT